MKRVGLKSQKFFKRWQRHLEDYLNSVALRLEETAKTAEAESIHQLRVSIRRTRVMIHLGPFICGKSNAEKFHAWSKRVADTVGRVRDYDIAIDWLRGQSAGAQLIAQVEQRRVRLWRAASRRLTPIPMTLRDAFFDLDPGVRKRNLLKKRFVEWNQELRDGILGDVGKLRKLGIEDQHELRRWLRRLRYLIEMVLGRRKQKRDRYLRQLIRLQRALGEMQDRIVVDDILQRLKATPRIRALRNKLIQERTSWLYKAEHELITLARL
ncbi:MAG: CHAD domain-containing protein [Verrucomicrobiota bacterium]